MGSSSDLSITVKKAIVQITHPRAMMEVGAGKCLQLRVGSCQQQQKKEKKKYKSANRILIEIFHGIAIPADHSFQINTHTHTYTPTPGGT